MKNSIINTIIQTFIVTAVLIIVSMIKHIGICVAMSVTTTLIASGMGIVAPLIGIVSTLLFHITELNTFTVIIILSILVIYAILSGMVASMVNLVAKIVVPIALTTIYSLSKSLPIEFLILNVVISVLSAIVFSTAVNSKFMKSGLETLLVYENLSIYAVIFLIASGLINLPIAGGNGFFLIVPITILVCSQAMKREELVTIAVTIAMGAYVETQDSGHIISVLSLLLLIMCIADINTILLSILAVIIETAHVTIFKTYANPSILNLIFYIISVLGFMLIPKSLINENARDNGGNTIQYRVIDRGRNEIAVKLHELSSVFDELKTMYGSIIKRKIEGEDAVVMCCSEMIKDVCKNCSYQQQCIETHGERVMQELKQQAVVAMARGSVNILDLTDFFASHCINSGNIMNCLNITTDNIREYNKFSESNNDCKSILKKQFGGLANILEQLASEMSDKLNFDRNLEEKVKELFKLNDIAVKEVFCYYKESEKPTVVVTLKNNAHSGDRIANIISKATTYKMTCISSMSGKQRNEIIATYERSAVYDIVYGIAKSTKSSSDTSGDTTTMCRISHDKMMMTLSDGMGTGDNARRISQKSITLIENLYKAGFNDDIVTATVNNLLSSSNYDAFTATDIVIFDLATLKSQIIKIGSPMSYLLHKREVMEITGESLPLGILDEVKPSKQMLVMRKSDMLVLMSDGVSDNLGNYIINILSETQWSNPQDLADTLLNYAQNTGGGKDHDDMTVLVAKVLQGN